MGTSGPLIHKHRLSTQHKSDRELLSIRPNVLALSVDLPPSIWTAVNTWGVAAQAVFESYFVACREISPDVSRQTAKTGFVKHWLDISMFRRASSYSTGMAGPFNDGLVQEMLEKVYQLKHQYVLMLDLLELVALVFLK